MKKHYLITYAWRPYLNDKPIVEQWNFKNLVIDKNPVLWLSEQVAEDSKIRRSNNVSVEQAILWVKRLSRKEIKMARGVMSEYL